jgi:hypothetical protein
MRVDWIVLNTVPLTSAHECGAPFAASTGASRALAIQSLVRLSGGD